MSALVVLLDANRKVVGACGYHQDSAIESGQSLHFETDIALPDQGRVASCQLVLYEDTEPIGQR